MTPEERDAFLGEERTCRVGTVGADGPHVTALWFVWDGACIWLNSIVKSQRWTDLQRDPRVTVLVDTGEGFGELRGVEIKGRAVAVGEVPAPAKRTTSWWRRSVPSARSTPAAPSSTTADTPGSGSSPTRS